MTAHSSPKPAIASLLVTGERYLAEVPDTLDFAERARYALNVLTRGIVPERSYSVWQNMKIDTNPPHCSWPNWLAFKYLEALPYMRAMTGDDMNLDVERAMMQAHLDRIGRFGLLYYPEKSPCSPPNRALAMSCARFMLAMGAWYERDGDPAWLDLIKNMGHGLDHMAIRRYHYAYYPSESGYSPEGTWAPRQSSRGRPLDHFHYTPPDEPAREQQGMEGSIKSDMGNVIRGLTKGYRLTGDEKLLSLARELCAFCLLPCMWEDGWECGIAGHEHGVHAGHFHGQVLAFRGMLDLAMLTGDERLKTLVREAYEHARKLGVPRAGWFPTFSVPQRFGRPADWASVAEGCGLADMVALAIALSDAGVGDYWDDVDHYARNHFVESQLIDVERMRSVAEHVKATTPAKDYTDPVVAPADLGIYDNVLERAVGGFGVSGIAAVGSVSGVRVIGCCTGNGTQALYYIWESILRHLNGTVTVNLLLNRTSPWADVASYLPYEGRVRIANKAASSIAVRVPGWANLDRTSVSVDGVGVSPLRIGRYLAVSGLKPGQALDVEFDVPSSESSYLVQGQRYTFQFRGSTVIGVSPRPDSRSFYPLYQREHMKAARAPLKKITRFVASG